MTIQDKIPLLLKQAYELCSRIMPVKDCRLYGSYARGDYDDESDVDIFVCVDLPEAALKQYRHAIAAINSNLSLTYDVTVSITVKTAETVARFSAFVPYYQNVLREGKSYAG